MNQYDQTMPLQILAIWRRIPEITKQERSS